MMVRQTRNKIVVTLLALIAMIPFQNCTGDGLLFSSNFSSRSSLASQTSDGGTIFDGKLSGVFYRLLPGFECEGSPAPLAELQIVGDRATLVINSKEKCATQVIDIDPKSLVNFLYDPDLVDEGSNIYVNVPQGVAFSEIHEFTEAWCNVSKNPLEGTDVTISYNDLTQIASAKVVTGAIDSGGRLEIRTSAAVGVSRAITPRGVSYHSPEMDLNVAFQSIAPAPGLYAGTFDAIVDGQSTRMQMNCRLGGYLDGAMFPLAFTGNSKPDSAVAARLINETSGSWKLTGLCDPQLGDVQLTVDGTFNSTGVSCRNNGTFEQPIFFAQADGSPAFSNDLGGHTVEIAQPPAQSLMTTIFKTTTTTNTVFVTNAAQLESVPVAASTLAILLNDIDLATEVRPLNNLRPIGSAAAPFMGVFDGNGHRILNLNLTGANPLGTGADRGSIGLFGTVQGGLLKNINVVNTVIQPTSGYFNGGALVGSITGRGRVENSSSFYPTVHSTYSSGLVGFANGADVHLSRVVGGSVRSGVTSAGLVGTLIDGDVTRSYSTATVWGTFFTGGLIAHMGSPGRGPARLIDSYGAGEVQYAAYSAKTGGLVGVADNGGLIERCLNVGTIVQIDADTNPIGGNGVGVILDSNDGQTLTGVLPLETRDSFWAMDLHCDHCGINPSRGEPGVTAKSSDELRSPEAYTPWGAQKSSWFLEPNVRFPRLRGM